jgi:hypothetical protein
MCSSSTARAVDCRQDDKFILLQQVEKWAFRHRLQLFHTGR